jgi:hypothetical protein
VPAVQGFVQTALSAATALLTIAVIRSDQNQVVVSDVGSRQGLNVEPWAEQGFNLCDAGD